jgi:hypothetical protein
MDSGKCKLNRGRVECSCCKEGMWDHWGNADDDDDDKEEEPWTIENGIMDPMHAKRCKADCITFYMTGMIFL